MFEGDFDVRDRDRKEFFLRLFEERLYGTEIYIHIK